MKNESLKQHLIFSTIVPANKIIKKYFVRFPKKIKKHILNKYIF